MMRATVRPGLDARESGVTSRAAILRWISMRRQNVSLYRRAHATTSSGFSSYAASSARES